MTNAQRQAGHHCTVLSFDDYRPKARAGSLPSDLVRAQSAAGVEIIRIGVPEDLHAAGPWLANPAFDLVHVHHEMLWKAGAALARQYDAPGILSVHTLQSEQNRLRGIESTLSSKCQTRALAECTLIHAPSQCVADRIRERDDALFHRLRVARLGCTLFPGAEEMIDREPSVDTPTLLYVGRFADINGFAELLDAVVELFAVHPTMRALIAGGLPGNPRAEKRWHRRWRERAGAHAERLRFCGWLSQSELAKLYSRANVLVVPSWFETFGQVLLEGMLHGTPIVTTGAGALAEQADTDTALLIAPRSKSAIAKGVLQILGDPIGTAQRAALAKRRAMVNYRWEKRIGSILELYREAVASHRDPDRRNC